MAPQSKGPRTAANGTRADLGRFGNAVPTSKVTPTSPHGKTMAVRRIAQRFGLSLSTAATVASLAGYPAGGAA